MDCRSFRDALEELLDGQLPAARRREAEAHARECPGCREELERCGPGVALPPVEPPPGLAKSILERTTGSTCSSARRLLGDLADGALSGLDADLVRIHLRACPECDALFRVLVALTRDLPTMAEVETAPGFVDGVLARTAGRRRPMPRRIASAASGLLRRPRLALEGAYAATLVVWLAVGVPAPLAEAPGRALAVVRRDVASARPLGLLARHFPPGFRELPHEVEARVSRVLGDLRAEVERRAHGAAGAGEDGVRHAADLEEALRRGKLEEAHVALRAMGTSAADLWKQVVAGRSDDGREDETERD